MTHYPYPIVTRSAGVWYKSLTRKSNTLSLRSPLPSIHIHQKSSMSTSAFSQTLQYITTIKLNEVERQRAACTKYVNDTVETASAAKDPITRLHTLIQRIDEWRGLGQLVSSSVTLSHYKQWLYQSRNDPSIAPSQVQDWSDRLEKQLRQAVMRYDYAKLFGDLLGEWLKSGDSLTVSQDSDAQSPSTEAPHVKGMREERTFQQDKIQELIFTSKETDTDAIREYLEELFSEPEAVGELDKLRAKLASFGAELVREKVTDDMMKNLINSLLARDLLDAEKTETLKSFVNNPVIVQEVTSVLNMQLAGIDEWEWPEEGVNVEMRRHLSGKYRAYMDNELMQALLFQYIGMKWSIAIKKAFSDIASSRAWKVETPTLSRDQLLRRKEFLDEGPALSTTARQRGRGRGGVVPSSVTASIPSNLQGTIEQRRRELQLDEFFMTQLPTTIASETPYDEEPKPGEKPNQGLNAQQVLLRLISTEVHLKKALHGSCTIMRADLEWFGPSLPHSSILAVLEFYGMPEKWLTFMGKWLNAKLRFDGNVNAGIRTRVRGVPIAHSLSVLCGEAVLFGMDFAVNQRAQGLYVYRIYDDFWLSTHDAELCATAWKEMTRYAELVGITFNMKKTGGVCVGADLEPSLPKGAVTWGFLTFDSTKGSFVVDQNSVDVHIEELKRQLSSARSVFGFVNALNKYLEFFRRNFAQPAPCFGRQHVDEVVATFSRILKAVFADTNGSVVLKVRQMIEERFGMKDIPAGWCFLPVSEGGLEVVNPIVSLLTVRDGLNWTVPGTEFTKRMERDVEEYDAAQLRWLNGVGDGKSETFMSYEEFILGRETRLSGWGAVWKGMQEVAEARNVPGATWDKTDVEDWIAALYEREITDWFGGSRIVEPTLIPVGLLSTFRSAKIAWDA